MNHIRLSSSVLFDHGEKGQKWLLCLTKEAEQEGTYDPLFDYKEKLKLALWIVEQAPDRFVLVEEREIIEPQEPGNPPECFLSLWLLPRPYWDANKERLLSLANTHSSLNELLTDVEIDL